jgi:Flp pilus assembly protein TadD
MRCTRTARIGLLATALVVTAGCYKRPIQDHPTLTSAELQTSYRGSQESARAIREGRFVQALALADRALLVAPTNAWAMYDRAVALHHLGETDASVEAFRAAEVAFRERANKGLAIYGRARVFADAGRYSEAHGAYDDFARMVRSFDPQGADLAIAYGKDCRSHEAAPADPVVAEATSALMRGDYTHVISAAETVRGEARSPWLDYDEGRALAALGRTDEAVRMLRRAELGFVGDRWAESVAIWGRALALDEAGRCDDARRAYDEYAKLTGEPVTYSRCSK